MEKLENYKNLYKNFKEIIISGDYDCSSLNKSQLPQVYVELLNKRIELEKTGNINNIEKIIDEFVTLSQNNHFINSEIHNLLGLFYYYQNDFVQGSQEFLKAMNLADDDQKLILEFNYLTGIDNIKNNWSLTLIPKWRRFSKKAFKEKNFHVLGLIQRRFTRFYLKNNRPKAALTECLEAVNIFKRIDAADDYYLSLCQLVEIYLQLGNIEEAQTQYEFILEPLSNRVKFPFEVISKKLNKIVTDPKNYSPLYKGQFWRQTSSVDKNQFNNFEYIWNIIDGEFFFKSDEDPISLKSNGLEGKLLMQIINKKIQNKHELIEYLWPNLLNTETINNRFFRLISRINKKLNGLISYDGEKYQLKNEVKVI